MATPGTALWLARGNQRVSRVGDDVCREQEEGHTDHPERPILAVTGAAGLLRAERPEDHECSGKFDDGVDAECHQRHTAGCESSSHSHDRLNGHPVTSPPVTYVGRG